MSHSYLQPAFNKMFSETIKKRNSLYITAFQSSTAFSCKIWVSKSVFS